jgi:hypothetical protein
MVCWCLINSGLIATNALAFLVETDKLWFTVIFWLLLLGSAATAVSGRWNLPAKAIKTTARAGKDTNRAACSFLQMIRAAVKGKTHET